LIPTIHNIGDELTNEMIYDNATTANCQHTSSTSFTTIVKLLISLIPVSSKFQTSVNTTAVLLQWRIQKCVWTNFF